MASQAQRWADELIDLGPRNTLLHFKDTKTGSLDLTAISAEQQHALLAGRKVRLASLVPDPSDHKSACLRARHLRRRILELDEEQGVEAGRLACGLLNVDPPKTRGTTIVLPLRAPLVLLPLTIQPRTATENDFVFQVDGEPEINPVLLYALNRQYGLDADLDQLADQTSATLEEQTEPGTRVRAVYDLLAKALHRSGLSVSFEERLVVGAFSFDRLPMVNDLKNSGSLLAEHPVIAAIAGDSTAAHSLLEDTEDPPAEGEIPPREEFLIHDADASQQQAIRAVLAGRHVVIEGPPGTGKSQTIANLIAALAAEGRRILFVAEKRAAIEAVTDRLAQVDLDGLVLDLHGNKLNRRQLAQQLLETLDRSGQKPPPRPEQLHASLEHFRGQTGRHVAEFHQPRSPWGVSAYQAMAALSGIPPECQTRWRLRGGVLKQLDLPARQQVERDLHKFVSRKGLQIRRGQSPWARARVRDIAELRPVLERLDQLAGTAFLDTCREIEKLITAAGLCQASDVQGWQQLLDLLQAVSSTFQEFTPEVFGPQLDRLVAATADRAWRKQHGQPIGWWQRRSLVREAMAIRRDGLRDRQVLHTRLVQAQEQRTRWQSVSVDGTPPSVVPELGATLKNFIELRDRLAAVALCAGVDDWAKKPANEVAEIVRELDEDRGTLYQMPELNQLTDRLETAGLGPLLDELTQSLPTPEVVVDRFQYAWWSSVLDEIKMHSQHVRTFTEREHDHAVTQFRRTDSDHMTANAGRVRYSVAARLRKARDTHRDQNAVVRDQAARKTRHLPLRKLVARAPDVLLAAKPCWAMSPLVVSRVLPATRLFDVVVFDEASQILPHDAMTSIMRGRQVVVAGDRNQLPPTSFFSRVLSGTDNQEDADDEDRTDPSVFESLLDLLSSRLPRVHTLRWHYRSSDERLIAFSNREIYRDQLITFPGTAVASPILLDVVDGHALPGQDGSAPQEVERVVKLALDHASLTPNLSLGIITMGQRHADRIDLALRKALEAQPDLQGYFSPEAGLGRRFFIKNLERVQGDERDAIILSIGYAKAANGRLAQRFGPLNNEGGERRLNVAITRARNRMTVVSSFSHHDFGPRGETKNRGPELLRLFLEYCAVQGDLTRSGGRQETYELNPFEQQVLDALLSSGVPAVPQWGVSGYRIDFALAHPERPGQMLLAVETDGDRYHRTANARDRDRLRQAHLEQLGWQFHRIWAADWFANPQTETDRLVSIWQDAVRAADEAPSRTAPQASVPTPRQAEEPSTQRGHRPALTPGGSIGTYSDTDLRALAGWILSDGYQLDRDTRVGQAMTELGFQKRERVIVERLNQAFDHSQQFADKEPI
ncbi:AAA domain-containing protein [Kitasatospora fiedleri]|uniref:AAA domain-containing protein n=1 Tax=Kitasatospora fiedleri TaxID=2991545 RepID=UPI00249B6416|nr:AAA domain-containing protein [Kitasatospora fiedleri]